MLSFIYRLLSRFKTQDEITQDMQLTFEEAQAYARVRGWWSYSIFAVKEIGGLFGLPTKERWWLRTAGWALAGLAAGWIVSYFVPERFTSEATLRLVPGIISQDLLPQDAMDLQNLLEKQKPIVLSRNGLITIVNNFDLYKGERQREPMEDVVDGFRKSVRIELAGPKVIRVAFTYPDRLLARKVTADLVNWLISQNVTQSSSAASESVQFFQDEVDMLGKSWLTASATVKTTPASDPRYELLVLERDLKQKEYESTAQKLGIVKTLRDMESRGQGPSLGLLDEPTLPQEADTPSSVILLAGLGCGFAIGLLIALWRALRRTTPDFGVPSAVKPA
jgi:uncharacterized protein involved in exopolysaccharide biosynthesis